MTALDFIYDGLLLSDLGYIICQFNEPSGFNSSSAGSQLSFTTVPQMNGKKHFLVNSEYDSRFENTFSICKPNGEQFTLEEYEFIMRWLNRSDFHELVILSEGFNEVIFNGTFNIDKVEFHGRIVGFNLKFISDSPFGKMKQEVFAFVIAESGGSITIYDKSDEIGHIYPDSFSITCLADGELTIHNSIEDRDTVIKDCKTNETILFDGTASYISSSLGRNIWDDFNFKFPRIANTLKCEANIFSFSLPCEVKIKYTPIKKVVF